MDKVIVNKNGTWEAISLEDFERDYHISPHCTGDTFILLQQDSSGALYKYTFPNPACIFMDGQIKYIIYKGNQVTVINGVRMPSADFIDESQVFASEEEFLKWVEDYNNTGRGDMYIDTPSGKHIKIGQK